VRGMSGGQGEEDRRQELGESDVAEVERALGELVDLPPDGDVHHLQTEDGQQSRAEEPAVVQRAKSAERVRAKVVGHGRWDDGHPTSVALLARYTPLIAPVPAAHALRMALPKRDPRPRDADDLPAALKPLQLEHSGAAQHDAHVHPGSLGRYLRRADREDRRWP